MDSRSKIGGIKLSFFMFFKTFLFSLLSSSLITPVFANQSHEDFYWYGYSWGGMYGACLAYNFNQMSKKDAKQSVITFLNIGKENIKDRQLLTTLKKLQAQVFAKDCKDVM